MHQGLKFVQSLFVKWADLDWKRLNTYSLRKIDHLDGTQPEVLLNYLPHIGAGYIPIKHLWEIWVKWAREVKYPGIPFLPTESDFVQHLRYSLMKKGHVVDYYKGEAEFLKPPISCGNPSKQELIHQHGIQFFGNLGLDPGHQPSYYSICQFAQHLGRLQLRLLEHHEPVAEWFDNLSHSLQEQLYHLGNNHEYPRDSKETIYCVKRLYLNLVPSFFGILTILEDNYFPLKASNKDRLITNAWAFLKQHLTQWKNLSLKMSSTQESVPDIPENPYFKTYQVLDRVFRMKPKKYVKLHNLLELYEIGHLDLSNKNPRVLSQSKKISLEEKLKAFYVHMSQEASNKAWNKA
ncbi:hypothetical protein DFH28DRAFT_878176 [Melampsora americana]|nr:hypothetical protein DFH28DRAFT_878176 [Melampsora americana]